MKTKLHTLKTALLFYVLLGGVHHCLVAQNYHPNAEKEDVNFDSKALGYDEKGDTVPAERLAETARWKAKYETTKNELQQTRQKLEQALWTGTALFVFLFCGAYWRQQRLSKELARQKSIMEAQIKELSALDKGSTFDFNFPKKEAMEVEGVQGLPLNMDVPNATPNVGTPKVPAPQSTKTRKTLLAPKKTTEAAAKTSDLPPEWVRSLENLLDQHIGDVHFSINDLPPKLTMSRRNFFRRIKEHTGLTPNQYLREIRLQKARKLIETRQLQTVKEVAHAVGFLKTDYFSELFRKRFGSPPSKYFVKY